jgi:hypothetical protein
MHVELDKTVRLIWVSIMVPLLVAEKLRQFTFLAYY